MNAKHIRVALAAIGIAAGALALWLGVQVVAHEFTIIEGFSPVNASGSGVVTATCDNSEKLSISVAGTAMTEQGGFGEAKDTWKLAATVTQPATGRADRWVVFFVRDVAGLIGTVNYNTNHNGFYTVTGSVLLHRGWLENPSGETSRDSDESHTMQPEENGDYFLVGAVWDQDEHGGDHVTYLVNIEASANLSCDRNNMGVYVDLKSPHIFSGDGYIDYYDDNVDPSTPIKTWWIQP